MDMLFFGNEIQKVSKKVGQSGRNIMRLQDPRVNGQLRKDQIARETEAKEVENRRNRSLNGDD
ncbi:hypothetical protein MKY37_14690 [Psychrobacillus sp. FSL K6-2836]|uniref:hypothetical protein n=1 Tax=Psychrobacillus sp. FSL K6-2836 TaxID=2921548 RepID=UPI0030F5B89F